MRTRWQPSRSKFDWTEDDINTLIWGWEMFDVARIASRLRRTELAVYRKACELDLVGHRENYFSMRKLTELSGFPTRAVFIVLARLGIEPHLKARSTPGKREGSDARSRRYAFTHEEAERILAELKRLSGRDRINPSFEGEWGTGRKPAACLACGSTERPHSARGLCTRCWERRQREKTQSGIPAGFVTLSRACAGLRRRVKALLVIAQRAGVPIRPWKRLHLVAVDDVQRLRDACASAGRYVTRGAP